MYIEEIKLLLENKVAPKQFRINSDFYGFQYGQLHKKKLFKKIMLTLDLSLNSIHHAVKNKIDLIISNHSLFNNPISKINLLLTRKLYLLSKSPMSIYILNSSFIAAEGGISDTIMEVLYLKLDQIFSIKNQKHVKIPIGRICLPQLYPNEKNSLLIRDLLKRIKNNLNLKQVSYVGDLNALVNKICIVGGEIIKPNLLNKALNCGCDCYISETLNYLTSIYAKEIGLNLLLIPHYKIGKIAMKKLCNILSLEFPRDEFFFFESDDPITSYF